MGLKTFSTLGCSVSTDAKLESRSVASCTMEAQVEASPDYLFGLLADPTKHNTLFDSIEGVESVLLADDGDGILQWKVDYSARWKFWRVSGLMNMRLIMDTNKHTRTVSFRLREPGFLKVYEGEWRITGAALPSPLSPGSSTSGALSSLGSGRSSAGLASMRSGSGGHLAGLASITNSMASVDLGAPGLALATPPAVGGALPVPVRRVVSLGRLPPTLVVFTQRMGPTIAPPFPINQALKGQASGQAVEMLGGLLAEAKAAGMLGGDCWERWE